MSLKLESGTRMTGGRLFVGNTGTTLRAALAGVPVETVEIWNSKDVRSSHADSEWLNCLAIMSDVESNAAERQAGRRRVRVWPARAPDHAIIGAVIAHSETLQIGASIGTGIVAGIGRRVP
jgi:hypothetical protein